MCVMLLPCSSTGQPRKAHCTSKALRVGSRLAQIFSTVDFSMRFCPKDLLTTSHECPPPVCDVHQLCPPRLIPKVLQSSGVHTGAELLAHCPTESFSWPDDTGFTNETNVYAQRPAVKVGQKVAAFLPQGGGGGCQSVMSLTHLSSLVFEV